MEQFENGSKYEKQDNAGCRRGLSELWQRKECFAPMQQLQEGKVLRQKMPERELESTQEKLSLTVKK